MLLPLRTKYFTCPLPTFIICKIRYLKTQVVNLNWNLYYRPISRRKNPIITQMIRIKMLLD